MGEMADFALDIAFKQQEHHERYQDAPLHVQYEEGLIDERGITFGNPSSTPFNDYATKQRQIDYARTNNPIGPGECPRCGGSTHHVVGQFGNFYGCNNYPSCRGSRNDG